MRRLEHGSPSIYFILWLSSFLWQEQKLIVRQYSKSISIHIDNLLLIKLIFDSKHWKNASEQVKDLIRKMLLKNPKKRLSAKDVLAHQWFKMKLSVPPLTSEKSTSRLIQNLQQQKNSGDDHSKYILDLVKNFRSGAKFKKEVTKVLINQLNEMELQGLKEAFQKIDVDNSGTITVMELKQAMIDSGFNASTQELERLINTISLEEDQVENQFQDNQQPLVIKYSDFLAAAIDERRYFTRDRVQNLWSLFKYFDTDGANFITKEDIKEAFARHGRNLSDEKIDQMIFEIDPNHDNRISFDEFCGMMGLEGVEQTIKIKDDTEGYTGIYEKHYENTQIIQEES